MPDDQDALRSLTPEQALERARAGKLESEYWQLVLADLHTLHDGVHAIADELQSSTLAVLGLLPIVHSVGGTPLETIVEANRSAMVRLRAMQSTLAGMLELVDGRSKVSLEVIQSIADSLGLKLPDDDASGEP